MLVAWAIVLVWHVLESFTKIKAVGLYVMPVVLVLLTIALIEYDPPVGLAPALRSDIVILHVIVMLTAIGCLYVAGGAAIIYLIEESLLRRRKTGGVLGRLPSLATLDKLIYHATLLGLPFLTMGMAGRHHPRRDLQRAGVVDGPHGAAVGRRLGAVPGAARGRVRADWSGRAVSWLAVTGLVVLLVIRFAAVPYLSGFHTYGG